MGIMHEINGSVYIGNKMVTIRVLLSLMLFLLSNTFYYLSLFRGAVPLIHTFNTYSKFE